MRDPSDETDPGGLPRPDGRWRTAAVVCAIVAAVHAATLWGTGPVDDDYIVYRYARNWLAGDGLVFNVGDPAVEGATSMAWLFVCALGLRLGVAPEVWSPALGVAASAVLAFAVARAAGRIVTGRAIWLPPALVALSPAVAWHANAGLGTVPLAAAIAVGVERWSAWSESGSARALAAGGVAMAFACGLRSEAALVWLVWLALARGPVRGAAWGWALLPGFVLFGVTAGRWAIYGTLLPHAYHMKSLPLVSELEYGARYLVRSATEGGLAVFLLLGAFVPKGDRRARAVGVAAVAGLVQVMLVGGDWMVYGRFLVPYVALGALAAAVVVSRLVRQETRTGGAVALVVLSLVGLVARPQAVFESRFFEAWWRDVGDALRDRSPDGSTVAVSPIGAIGWRSELRVVDVLGLTHRAFLDAAPDLENVRVKGHHRHDGEWVLDQAPVYVLLGNAVVQPGTASLDVNPWEADIVRDPRFAREYAPFDIEVRRRDGTRQTLPYFARRDARPLR